MTNHPLYRLRELIYAKYGEEKFALGCEIVARWLNCKKESWHQEKVLCMCNTPELGSFSISQQDGEKLRHLFGLQSVEELFTN